MPAWCVSTRAKTAEASRQSIDVARVETVGLDLGKRWFHVHGVDGRGETCVNRRLPRSRVEAFFAALPRCLVAMETCGGAHHWGRLLTSMGHAVKLIPAQFVRPYVKSNENDAADAEAICEAAQRPDMRFAAVKDLDAQALQSLHRTRRLLVKQRTQMLNSLRGHCAEFGVVAPQNRTGVTQLIDLVQDPDDARLPDLARTALAVLVGMLETLQARIAELDQELLQWHRSSPVSRRLGAIPGVGPLTATALTAALGDGRHFRSGRQFAAASTASFLLDFRHGLTNYAGISFTLCPIAPKHATPVMPAATGLDRHGAGR